VVVCWVRCLLLHVRHNTLRPTLGNKKSTKKTNSQGANLGLEAFLEEHGGRTGNIAVYGQESDSTTWRLALMNLAISGFEGDLGPDDAETFLRNLHPDLRADYVLANPLFNDADWFRKMDSICCEPFTPWLAA
jgi:hypothetical protein